MAPVFRSVNEDVIKYALLAGNCVLAVWLGLVNYQGFWNTYDQMHVASVAIRTPVHTLPGRPHNVGQFLPAWVLVRVYDFLRIPLTEAAFDVPYVLLYALAGPVSYLFVKEFIDDYQVAILASYAVVSFPIFTRAGRVSGNGFIIFSLILQLSLLTLVIRYLNAPTGRRSIVIALVGGFLVLTDPLFAFLGPAVLTAVYVERPSHGVELVKSRSREILVALLPAICVATGHLFVFVVTRHGILGNLFDETQGSDGVWLYVADYVAAFQSGTSTVAAFFLFVSVLSLLWIPRREERFIIPFVYALPYNLLFVILWSERLQPPDNVTGFLVWAVVPLALWFFITLPSVADDVVSLIPNPVRREYLKRGLVVATAALIIVTSLGSSVAMVTQPNESGLTGSGIEPYVTENNSIGHKAAGAWLWQRYEASPNGYSALAIGYQDHEISYYFPRPAVALERPSPPRACIDDSREYRYIVAYRSRISPPESHELTAVIRRGETNITFIYGTDASTIEDVDIYTRDSLVRKFNHKYARAEYFQRNQLNLTGMIRANRFRVNELVRTGRIQVDGLDTCGD